MRVSKGCLPSAACKMLFAVGAFYCAISRVVYFSTSTAICVDDFLTLTCIGLRHCTLFKKALTLYSGKLGEVERIGEFTIMFNESLNMSKATWTQSGAEWTPVFPAH
jgi:hypothetical protein